MAKEISEDLKEVGKHLDEQNFRKGIEKVMALGGKANNYFSDQAPWALIKEDRDKAAQVLAYSSAFALCLGVAFRPFLPDLSAKILKHFEAITNDEQIAAIYNGDVSVLKEIFRNGHILEHEVVALVPKIQDDVIKGKKEELEKLG